MLIDHLPIAVMASSIASVLTDVETDLVQLVKRINIPVNASTTPAQIEAMSHDPWRRSGAYALGWVYFGLVLLFVTTILRLWYYWGDRIRVALFKHELETSALSGTTAMSDGYPNTAATDYSTRQIFFPPEGPLPTLKQQSTASALAPLNNLIALFRFVFYRPMPQIRIGALRLGFPSPAVVVVGVVALTFTMLYCFLPQPLYYASMGYGSPPLAVRAGMLSIALVPWIVALGCKGNLITLMTGIGHERLIVLHRWGAYLCTLLALVHAVPYWVQSARDREGFAKFQLYFDQQYPIFATGIACLVALLFLFVHSLPVLRNRFYELFVVLHIPISWAFVGLLFWHSRNYLTSWAYLYTTVLLLAISLVARMFWLNWMNPLRPSFLIGEESAVTILPEKAVKVTVPTQMKWKPGQYAYLRMPGISAFENHPFTIASLCSEALPSDYGDAYRNMTMVFRPFSGFTRKVLDTAEKKGPYKTYRSYIEGPYGGMQRQLASFDQVIFVAGGSGITAIVSQLLDLISRMRDGKATTRSVYVIWSMKRPEIMDWFKEELRICREYAPSGCVQVNFYITSTQRYQPKLGPPSGNRLSQVISDTVDHMLGDISSKRDSRIIAEAKSKADEEEVTALPQVANPISGQPYFPPPPPREYPGKGKRPELTTRGFNITGGQEKLPQAYTDSPSNTVHTSPHAGHVYELDEKPSTTSFDFGFPATPSKFQRSLMNFAQLPANYVPSPSPDHERPTQPAAVYTSPIEQHAWTPATTLPEQLSSLGTPRRIDGWKTEYGRPDIAALLQSMTATFSRRTCVYVCGPPEMRCEVSRTVANLQRLVWTDHNRDEIHLHAENYAI